MRPVAGPADPGLVTQWRHERRRVALAHHPDRGGQVAELVAGLDAVDRRYRAGTYRARVEIWPGAGRTARGRRALRAAGRRIRRGGRRMRGSLPRAVPGARRYIEL